MARPGIPYTFRPKGYSDAVDGTNAFPGAMQQLSNLVPAPSTANVFVPRPAAQEVYDFGDFTDPGQLTALLTIGTRAYGMIASGAFPGFDEPFCYDVALGTFIPISGVLGTNLPASQSTSGDWQPPKLVGVTSTKIIVTHVGFDGITNFFGVIDISIPGAPAWSAGNTTVNPLVDVPISVAGFNGRAWYAVGNSLVFSDALNPTVVTNATQVLTLGDNEAVTALAGLPLSSATQGGIIGSLIAFKGDATIYQITGDQTTSNLVLNELNVSVGTRAPNTICSTPLGLAFVAPDGLRIIDFTAQVSDPIGANGSGCNVPLLSAINPSRMCAAFNQNVLRISCQNGNAQGQPQQEYWLDFNLKIWTGPHTFPSALIQPYQGASGVLSGHGFVFAAFGINAKLWQGGVTPIAADSYVENGQIMSWSFQTVLLPDNSQISENKVVDSTLAVALPGGQIIGIQMLNSVGDVLDTVYLSAPAGGGATWGSFTWGSTTWGILSGFFKQYRLPWHVPLVFKQGSLQVSGASQAGMALGNVYLKYQPLGYVLQETGTGL